MVVRWVQLVCRKPPLRGTGGLLQRLHLYFLEKRCAARLFSEDDVGLLPHALMVRGVQYPQRAQWEPVSLSNSLQHQPNASSAVFMLSTARKLFKRLVAELRMMRAGDRAPTEEG